MAAESALQRKVIADLKKKGWVEFRVKTNGWPDRGFIRSMEIFWIEFKAPKKKPRPLQKYVHDQVIRKNGFCVYVVDTWEGYLKLGI